MLGACAGSVFASRWNELRALNSLTAGLFFGLALLLILPEALSAASWPMVLLFSAAGCALFALIDVNLHHGLHRSTQWTLIFSVIAIHNIMDGWNIGIGSHVEQRAFVMAFSFGMGIHKLVGGFAIGAMLRTRMLYAALAEGVTIVGLLAEHLLLPHLGHNWTGWLLAATGGSLLFLAVYIFAEACHEAGLARTARYATLGFLIIAVAAVAERF